MKSVNEDPDQNIKSFIAQHLDPRMYFDSYISESVHLVGNNELKKIGNMQTYQQELDSIKQRNRSRVKAQEQFAIVYEIFIRHYGASGSDLESIGKLRDITFEKLKGLKEMGVTHVWLMGLLDTNVHPYLVQGKKPQWIKGEVGSPYSVFSNRKIDRLYLEDTDTGFDEFTRLIHDARKLDVAIMIDLVPAHTAWAVENDRWIGNPDFEFVPFRKSGRNHYVGQYLLPSHGGIGNFRWRDTAEIDFSYNDLTDPKSVYCIFDQIVAFWQSHGVKGFRTDVSDGCPADFWDFIISRAKERDPDVFFLCEALSSFGDGLSFLGELDRFDAVYNYPFYHIVRNLTKGCWAQDLVQYPFDYDLKDFFPNDRLLYFQSHHDTHRMMSDQYSFYSLGSEVEKQEVSLQNFVHTALRSNGQIMLYNGDEVGDPGNTDGMSPLKGLYTFRERFNQLNSANGGSETEFYRAYSYILNFCHREIIRRGEYSNLFMSNSAANEHSPRMFYNRSIDAFFRTRGEHVLLVIGNFSVEFKEISLDLTQLRGISKSGTSAGVAFTDVSLDRWRESDLEFSTDAFQAQVSRVDLVTKNAPTFRLKPRSVKMYEIHF